MKLPGKLCDSKRLRGAGDNGLLRQLWEEPPRSAHAGSVLGSPPSLVGDPCQAMLSAKLIADVRQQKY